LLLIRWTRLISRRPCLSSGWKSSLEQCCTSSHQPDSCCFPKSTHNCSRSFSH